jgi:hypothetical protein
MRSPCCARAASGKTAAPNSRRRKQMLIRPSHARLPRTAAACRGEGLEAQSKSDNYGGSPSSMLLSCRLGERLCRCFNSAQSRNLRHALTPAQASWPQSTASAPILPPVPRRPGRLRRDPRRRDGRADLPDEGRPKALAMDDQVVGSAARPERRDICHPPRGDGSLPREVG